MEFSPSTLISSHMRVREKLRLCHPQKRDTSLTHPQFGYNIRRDKVSCKMHLFGWPIVRKINMTEHATSEAFYMIQG